MAFTKLALIAMTRPVISTFTPRLRSIRVLEAMLPYFSGQFGNAASKQHASG